MNIVTFEMMCHKGDNDAIQHKPAQGQAAVMYVCVRALLQTLKFLASVRVAYVCNTAVITTEELSQSHVA